MDVLTKNAARAGLRRLRQALSGAERLEQQVAHSGAAHGVLEALQKHKADASHLMSNPNAIGMGRNLPFGSQIRVLGGGNEGMAQHVIRPGQGASEVLKIHDPRALAHSDQTIANKDKLIGKNIPGVAKLHGRATMPGTVDGKQMPAYFSEYVPGRNANVQDFRHNPEQFQQLYQSSEHGVPGMKLLDVQGRAGNIKMTPQGPKAIDYLPVPERDAYPMAVRQALPANMLGAHMVPGSESLKSFRNGETGISPTTGTTIRQAYGQAPQHARHTGAVATQNTQVANTQLAPGGTPRVSDKTQLDTVNGQMHPFVPNPHANPAQNAGTNVARPRRPARVA